MDFDLSAAKWRDGIESERAYIESLAVRLEQALPKFVTVERKKESLFAKRLNVVSIRVRFESVEFRLRFNKNRGIEAEKEKIVRGISLKTDRIDFEQWLSEFSSELNTLVQKHANLRSAVDTFLFS